MTWNGIPAIDLGGGAWEAGYRDGIANLAWSGVYDTAYTLDYHATIPLGDPSGLGGVGYALHLEGIVPEPIPVPAAVWLLSSGLTGLAGMIRRREA